MGASNSIDEAPSVKSKTDRSQSVGSELNVVKRRKKTRSKDTKIKRNSLPDDVTNVTHGDRPKWGDTSHEPSMRLLPGTRIPPPDYGPATPPPVGKSRIDTKIELLRRYNHCIDKLLQAWPKYQYFRTIDPSKLAIELLVKLIELVNHILDQGDTIRNLTAENERIKHFVAHRDDLVLSSHDDLQNRSSTNSRGSPKFQPNTSLKRSSANSSPAPDYDVDPKEQLLTEIKRLRDSATVSQNNRKSVILDQGSTSPLEGSPVLSQQRRIDEYKRKIELLTAELQATKIELDKDRSHRVQTKPTEESAQIQLPLVADISANRFEIVQEVSARYGSLDRCFLNEMKAELDLFHRLLDDKTKFTFLCAIVMKSFAACRGRREEMLDRMREFVLDPLRDCKSPDPFISSSKYNKQSSVLENIIIFEAVSGTHTRKTRGLLDGVVKLFLYVASKSAESCDVKPLVQDVYAALQKEYPRILTPSISNSKVIQKLVVDMCRMCWQMVLLDPPLHLSIGASSFMDEIHQPYRSQRIPGAQIDYHLLPTLYAKEDESEVLIKGRVAIRVIR